MKAKTIAVGFIILAVVLGAVAVRHFTGGDGKAGSGDIYYCPMHHFITSDKPGECPICGMSLVKRGENLEATDLTDGVYISPEKQQLIGVKKGKVEKRKLTGQILTVGRVAYDPQLYTAQQEYVQTMRSSGTIRREEGYIEQQSADLMKSMKQKLLAMGMSEEEIAELEKRGKPEQNLYLPTSEDKNVWVYISVYEYEAQLVKAGTPVEVRAVAYPGQVFEGKVIAVTPIIEAATRTLKVRALVNNPENKLKLEMFVNVAIKYDLGDKISVPEEAVMHAGTRDIVFVAGASGHFESRVVKLGNKAGNYYEVLEGLAENEEVVTSGNFLVDSESKLNAGFNKASEPNK
ncbi:MAG: efflux RND transporter periplasmic adaptor subunit [Sedimentisphaerales bacterium]|jgi:Cu(I)/Ag(I) efflux system membrane fusion protein